MAESFLFIILILIKEIAFQKIWFLYVINVMVWFPMTEFIVNNI